MGLGALLTGRLILKFKPKTRAQKRDEWARIHCDVPIRRTRLEMQLLEERRAARNSGRKAAPITPPHEYAPRSPLQRPGR